MRLCWNEENTSYTSLFSGDGCLHSPFETSQMLDSSCLHCNTGSPTLVYTGFVLLTAGKNVHHYKQMSYCLLDTYAHYLQRLSLKPLKGVSH